MTATATRIGFVLQEYRVAVAEDTDNSDRYGALARSDDEAVPTVLDNASDAQIIADERISLLGRQRRRFDVVVQSVDELIKLRLGSSLRYIDTETDCDRAMLVLEAEIDLADQTSKLVLWG